MFKLRRCGNVFFESFERLQIVGIRRCVAIGFRSHILLSAPCFLRLRKDLDTLHLIPDREVHAVIQNCSSKKHSSDSSELPWEAKEYMNPVVVLLATFHSHSVSRSYQFSSCSHHGLLDLLIVHQTPVHHRLATERCPPLSFILKKSGR